MRLRRRIGEALGFVVDELSARWRLIHVARLLADRDAEIERLHEELTARRCARCNGACDDEGVS